MPVRAFLLGVVAGSRTMTPVAALATRYDDRRFRGGWRAWPMFRSELGRALLVVGAAGELVVDKLPQTPSRVRPSGLAGRMLSGALVGVAISTVGSRRPEAAAGVVGAAGALLGSVVGYGFRVLGGRVTRLPDPVLAVAEDAAAVAGARRILRG